MEVSKKQTVESTNEEPSLVRFILKLKLLHLLFERGFQHPVPYNWSDYWRFAPVPYYWAGYSRVKSSTLTVDLRDQETQVGERATLLTFLTIVKEKTPHGFLLELMVCLTLYHRICDMYRTYELFNQGDDEMKAKRDSAMARTTALYEEIFGDLMDVQG